MKARVVALTFLAALGIGLVTPGAASAQGAKTKTFTLDLGSPAKVSTGIVLQGSGWAKLTVSGNGSCGEGSDCPAGNPLGSGQTCAGRSLGPLDPGPAPALPYGAVAGQLGSAPPFATRATSKVTGPGKLSLFYNDCADYYGDNTGSFTVKVVYKASAPVLRWANQPRIAKGAINLPYRGSGFDASGDPIKFSFSGEPAGTLAATNAFEGTLKINRWPHRTDVEGTLHDTSGGYCWGEMNARQGSTVASAGRIRGRWSGWILWSGDSRIKAHEAWCEGEDETFLSKAAAPIIAFGEFQPQNSRPDFGIEVFNLNHPAEGSNLYKLEPGGSLNISLTREHTCVRVAISLQGILSTTSSRGRCRT